MTDRQVERLASLAAAYIKAHPDTPYKSGNLKRNSLQVRKVAPYEYEIYIDIGIAPYQVYLNEYEHHAHRKKSNDPNVPDRIVVSDKPNKHYQWWEKMRVEVAQYLQGFISNGYDKDGIDTEMRRLEKIIEQQIGGK